MTSEIPIWSGATPAAPAPAAAAPVLPTLASLGPPKTPAPPAFPDADFFLPDGRGLLLTPGREALMHQLYGGEDMWLPCPVAPYECLTLLWLCAHAAEPFPWNARVKDDDGKPVPLYLRAHEMNDASRAWADASFPGTPYGDLQDTAIRLWLHHRGADVVPDPAAPGGEAEKKSESSPTRTSLISSPGSPPEETSPAATGSSGGCHSAMPSPPDTVI